MFFLCANFNPLAARADEVHQTGVEVKLFSVLVKIGHSQFGAQFDVTSIRLELAQDQLEECRFAGAVRPDDANFVALWRYRIYYNKSENDIGYTFWSNIW